jgi:hypothetical protein
MEMYLSTFFTHGAWQPTGVRDLSASVLGTFASPYTYLSEHKYLHVRDLKEKEGNTDGVDGTGFL